MTRRPYPDAVGALVAAVALVTIKELDSKADRPPLNPAMVPKILKSNQFKPNVPLETAIPECSYAAILNRVRKTIGGFALPRFSDYVEDNKDIGKIGTTKHPGNKNLTIGTIPGFLNEGNNQLDVPSVSFSEPAEIGNSAVEEGRG